MAPRLNLHELLESFTENVYFQPPENIKMVYPAIVYSRTGRRADYADNSPYRSTKQYLVTAITRDPDSDIPDKMDGLPLCTFERFFAADNLNHYVYTLFF